jgi:signal transduction histidine kinase
MGSDRSFRFLVLGVVQILSGGAAMTAWHHQMWASLTGALLLALWSLVLAWPRRSTEVMQAKSSARDQSQPGDAPLMLLIDQLPTPLLCIEASAIRALNRSAREVFATDYRIWPEPSALRNREMVRFVHAGRSWRISRAEPGISESAYSVLALIDVDAEERAGEARANFEVVQVMGHELLNGLAPIASLAESGLTIWNRQDCERERILPEILTTLARRTEGLQRFAEGYRRLARIPAPAMAPIRLADLVDEAAQLFRGQWNEQIVFSYSVLPSENCVLADRDQLTQALWALLQNAAEAALAGIQPATVRLDARIKGAKCVLAVIDSGNGVSNDQRGKIFNPFHSTKPEGTGIGLSLARQISRSHGGDLLLRDTMPTTFELAISNTQIVNRVQT